MLLSMDSGYSTAIRSGRTRSRPCQEEQKGCESMMCIAHRSREDNLAPAGRAAKCKSMLLLMANRILAQAEASEQTHSRLESMQEGNS